MDLDNTSVRYGFESAIEMCIVKLEEAKTKEDALAKLNELLGLAKGDKLEKLEEMLWTTRRRY